jgi:hypothetical protein
VCLCGQDVAALLEALVGGGANASDHGVLAAGAALVELRA